MATSSFTGGCCQTTRMHFMACVALGGINKPACGAKLILTADLACPVSCASLGHLPMAQHCPLCLNGCFSPPTAPHLPPHPSPTRPPPIDSIRDIKAIKKTALKTRSIQIAGRVSCENILMLATYITRLFILQGLCGYTSPL